METIVNAVIDFTYIFWLPKFKVWVDYLRPFFLMKHDENNPHFQFSGDANNTINRVIADEFANYLPTRDKYMTERNRNDALDVNRMFKVVKKVLEAFWQVGFFERSITTNRKHYECNTKIKFITSENQDTNIFASGYLTEDYRDSDPDPYETAGGYRTWVAEKGTKVYYSLDSQNMVNVTFDSNCIVDHYNNNFFGVSTGGGTTKYEIGERVEKRNYNFGYDEFLNTSDKKHCPFKARVTHMDSEKALRIAKKNLGIE